MRTAWVIRKKPIMWDTLIFPLGQIFYREVREIDLEVEPLIGFVEKVKYATHLEDAYKFDTKEEAQEVLVKLLDIDSNEFFVLEEVYFL